MGEHQRIYSSQMLLVLVVSILIIGSKSQILTNVYCQGHDYWTSSPYTNTWFSFDCPDEWCRDSGYNKFHWQGHCGQYTAISPGTVITDIVLYGDTSQGRGRDYCANGYTRKLVVDCPTGSCLDGHTGWTHDWSMRICVKYGTPQIGGQYFSGLVASTSSSYRYSSGHLFIGRLDDLGSNGNDLYLAATKLPVLSWNAWTLWSAWENVCPEATLELSRTRTRSSNIPGLWSDSGTENKECWKCVDHCADCEEAHKVKDSKDTCNRCEDTYKLDDGDCVKIRWLDWTIWSAWGVTCPETSQLESTSTRLCNYPALCAGSNVRTRQLPCVQCVDNCADCKNTLEVQNPQDTCRRCKVSYKAEAGQCVDFECGAPCATCPDPRSRSQDNKCMSCPAEWYLTDATCKQPRWGDWSLWSGCSVTCGPGTETRSRDCATLELQPEVPCDGVLSTPDSQTQACQINECYCERTHCSDKGNPGSMNIKLTEVFEDCNCECDDQCKDDQGTDISNCEYGGVLCLSQCTKDCNEHTTEGTCVEFNDNACVLQCDWHGDVLGCVRANEYIVDISMVFQSEDMLIIQDESHFEEYIVAHKFDNLGIEDRMIPPEDMLVPNHLKNTQRTMNFVDDNSQVERSGVTMNWHTFIDRAVSKTRQHAGESAGINILVTANQHSVSHQHKHSLPLRSNPQWTVDFDNEQKTVNVEWSTSMENDDIQQVYAQISEVFLSRLGRVDDQTLEGLDEQGYTLEGVDLESSTDVTINCPVRESICVKPLTTEVVHFSWSKVKLVYAVILPVTLHTNLQNDFTLNLQTTVTRELVSSCAIQRESYANLITDRYPCNELLQESMLVPGENKFEPRCALPDDEYMPLQIGVDSKWCSSPQGERDHSSIKEFNRIEINNIVELEENELDCTHEVKKSQLCEESFILDVSTYTLMDDNEVRVAFAIGGKGYFYGDNLKCTEDEAMDGFQRVVKVLIPARRAILMELHSVGDAGQEHLDRIHAHLRYGESCPGCHSPGCTDHLTQFQEQEKECKDFFELVNEDPDDALALWVIVQSDSRDLTAEFDIKFWQRNLGSLDDYENTCVGKGVDCAAFKCKDDTNGDQSEKDNFCQQFQSESQHRYCRYKQFGNDADNTILTAYDICPECGCCPSEPDCANVCMDRVADVNYEFLTVDCMNICGGDSVCNVCETSPCYDLGLSEIGCTDRAIDIANEVAVPMAANKFRCDCRSAYTGDLCEINTFCNEIHTEKPCSGNGKCNESPTEDYVCECYEGYRNFENDAVESVSENDPHQNGWCSYSIDKCRETPCRYGECSDGPCKFGQCTTVFDNLRLGGRYECDCVDGYIGMDCQEPEDYCAKMKCGVKSLECVNQALRGHCVCQDGWMGPLCETKIDYCADMNSCMNGSVCKSLQNGFICVVPCEGEDQDCSSECPMAYTGVYCHINVNDCLVDHENGELDKCTHGECIDGTWRKDDEGIMQRVHRGLYTCVCDPGYFGETLAGDFDTYSVGRVCEKKNWCSTTYAEIDGVWTEWTEDFDPINERSGPCDNGSTCLQNADADDTDYSCVCLAGWTGKNCDIDNANGCENNPCGAGHMCRDLVVGYECDCREGYEEIEGTCVDIDECLENDCGHGVCHNRVNDYICSCHPGWGKADGKKICDQDIDECLEREIDCGTHGSCTNRMYRTADQATCECEPNYAGDFCERDEICHPDKSACDLKHSSCERDNSIERMYKCNCDLGREGENCDREIDLCADNPCVHATSCDKGICTCEDGYNGEKCDQLINHCTPTELNPNFPCYQGSCVPLVGDYQCDCFGEWQGRDCNRHDELTNPCYTEGDVGKCGAYGQCLRDEETEEFTCRCNAGHEGDYCEINIDSCDGNECLQGECVDGDDASYTCDCLDGFTGKYCDINKDDCQNHLCVNGQCEDLINDYRCECQVGYTGQFCTQNINECETANGNMLCGNHGVCVDVIANFVCVCDDGYTGTFCQKQVNYCALEDTPCGSHGACISDFGVTCACDLGYTGERCNEIIDYCSEDPCEHGICNLQLDHYSCTCQPGYSGKNCDINVNDCSDNPCMNGFCQDGIDNYECDCHEGYEGTNCESRINHCLTNPCNHGTCSSLFKKEEGSYSCTCENGWNGRNCDNNIDDCAGNPCFRGSCTDKVADFDCVCNLGWMGDICDQTDFCSLSPCQNAGRCENLDEEDPETGNQYKCECVNDYTGPNCRTAPNYCLENPCVYGSCQNIVGAYKCNCQDGYTGRNCQISTNDCNHNECIFGTCLDTLEGFKCDCSNGYYGTHCEFELDECFGTLRGGLCGDHGTCSDKINHYVCDCDPGWNGNHCEIAECAELNIPHSTKVCTGYQEGTTCKLTCQTGGPVDYVFKDVTDNEIDDHYTCGTQNGEILWIGHAECVPVICPEHHDPVLGGGPPALCPEREVGSFCLPTCPEGKKFAGVAEEAKFECLMNPEGNKASWTGSAECREIDCVLNEYGNCVTDIIPCNAEIEICCDPEDTDCDPDDIGYGDDIGYSDDAGYGDDAYGYADDNTEFDDYAERRNLQDVQDQILMANDWCEIATKKLTALGAMINRCAVPNVEAGRRMLIAGKRIRPKMEAAFSFSDLYSILSNIASSAMVRSINRDMIATTPFYTGGIHILQPFRRECRKDEKCPSGYFCSSARICAKHSVNYCRDHACEEGDGDCDYGQCAEGFICKQNAFHDYHPSFNQPTWDACVPAQDCDTDADCENGFMCSSSNKCMYVDPEYCRYHECRLGDGDCRKGTCAEGFICGNNNFQNFHPGLGEGDWEACVPAKKCSVDDECISPSSGWLQGVRGVYRGIFWRCMSDGYCREARAHHCLHHKCELGDGDCEYGQCELGYNCVDNTFTNYHAVRPQCRHVACRRLMPNWDACEPAARCYHDGNCDDGMFCAHNGFCRTPQGNYNGQRVDYCQQFECKRGDGPCRRGQCAAGFICGIANFNDFHPNVLPDSGSNACIVATECKQDTDCPEDLFCASSGFCEYATADYCLHHACKEGDGDCDAGQCESGYECVEDAFQKHHPGKGTSIYDACERIQN